MWWWRCRRKKRCIRFLDDCQTALIDPTPADSTSDDVPQLNDVDVTSSRDHRRGFPAAETTSPPTASCDSCTQQMQWNFKSHNAPVVSAPPPATVRWRHPAHLHNMNNYVAYILCRTGACVCGGVSGLKIVKQESCAIAKVTARCALYK